MQIKGKRGITKCGFKIPCDKRNDNCSEHCISIDLGNEIPSIAKCREVDKQWISVSDKEIVISKPVGKHCPIAVFKAIVKMAISVMPVNELCCFSDTIKWLLNPKHTNIYTGKRLLVRYKMIPGFNVTHHPFYILYRRKRDVWNKPYMLFNLTYGCFSLLIEIPRDNDICSETEFLNIPFPEIPFHSYQESMWDLSEQMGTIDFRHSITLSFNAMTECTENVEIYQEKGKSKLKFKQ